MLPIDAPPDGALTIQPGYDTGTLLGKRYGADESGVQLLCTRAGDGAISIGEEVLAPKGSKTLPSSD
jgi:hypothetical protein